MKAGKVVRGTTQILIRLIRDKVWSIFCQAVSITNTLYGHFVFVNPVAKKELSDSGRLFANPQGRFYHQPLSSSPSHQNIVSV